MSYVSFLCAFIWCSNLVLLLSGFVVSLRKLTDQAEEKESVCEARPVSVLKPLCGFEDGLEENLESFFLLDYPAYELVFGVSSPKDPAKPVVEKLIRKYPRVPAQLKVYEVKIGKNPKINNLFWGYTHCRYPLVLISDSNIRVAPSYLKSMVSLLKEDVGVVTSAISGIGAKTFGASLESTYLNTYLLRWIHLSNRLGNPIVMGKSMLFRKRDLIQCGGIHALGNLIAEDYGASSMSRRLGLRVEVMGRPIDQYLGAFSFKAFWGRHVRWGRIRKSCEYGLFLAEPFSSAFISGVCGALAFEKIAGFWGVLLAHLGFCFFLEWSLACQSGVQKSLKMLTTWLALECLTLPLWVSSLCGNTVNWRGTRLKLLPGGRL